MRSLKTVFFLILLSGCSMEKYCSERYPPQVKDSTYVKYDTLNTRDTLFIGSESISLDTALGLPFDLTFHSEEKKGRLTSTVDIRKGKLTVKCDSDSLQKVIDRQNFEKTTYREKKEVKTIPCNEEHRTTLDYACRWFSLIAVILILIAVVIKCFRG